MECHTYQKCHHVKISSNFLSPHNYPKNMISFKKRYPNKPDDKSYIVRRHKRDKKKKGTKKECKCTSDFRPECRISPPPLLRPNYPYTFCTLQMDIVEVNWCQCKHFVIDGFWTSLLFPYNTKEIKPIKLTEVYKRMRQKKRKEPESISSKTIQCNNVEVNLHLFEDERFVLPKESNAHKSVVKCTVPKGILKENKNIKAGKIKNDSKKFLDKFVSKKKNVETQTDSSKNLDRIFNLTLIKALKENKSQQTDSLEFSRKKLKSDNFSACRSENNMEANSVNKFNNENKRAESIAPSNDKLLIKEIMHSEPGSDKKEQSSSELNESSEENVEASPVNNTLNNKENKRPESTAPSNDQLLTLIKEDVTHSESGSDNKEQSSSELYGSSEENIDSKLACTNSNVKSDSAKSSFRDKETLGLVKKKDNLGDTINRKVNDISTFIKTPASSHVKEQVPHSESGTRNNNKTLSVLFSSKHNVDKKDTCPNSNVKSHKCISNFGNKEIEEALESIKKVKLVDITNKRLRRASTFIKTPIHVKFDSFKSLDLNKKLLNKKVNPLNWNSKSQEHIKTKKISQTAPLNDIIAYQSETSHNEKSQKIALKVSEILTEMACNSEDAQLVKNNFQPLDAHNYDLYAEDYIKPMNITNKTMDLPLNDIIAARSETSRNEKGVKIALKVSEILTEIASNKDDTKSVNKSLEALNYDLCSNSADYIKPMKITHKTMDLALDDIVTAGSEVFHARKSEKIAIKVSEILKEMENNNEDADILFIRFKEYVRI